MLDFDDGVGSVSGERRLTAGERPPARERGHARTAQPLSTVVIRMSCVLVSGTLREKEIRGVFTGARGTAGRTRRGGGEREREHNSVRAAAGGGGGGAAGATEREKGRRMPHRARRMRMLMCTCRTTIAQSPENGCLNLIGRSLRRLVTSAQCVKQNHPGGGGGARAACTWAC